MDTPQLDPVHFELRFAPQVFACGFSWRKQPMVRQFTGVQHVQFVSTRHAAQKIQAGADLLLWGAAPVPPGLPPGLPLGVPPGVRIIRLEDGFLRSVGLGADLVRPLSWVVDDVGLYLDATRPSRLEQLLQDTAWTEDLLLRAQALRHTIVQQGISKYNLGGTPWQRPQGKTCVRLVMGQVQTDASIRLGALGVNTNMGLLQQVRSAYPDDWIVYKHHPDVVAGLRQPGAQDHQCHQWSNQVLTQGSPSQVMAQVDAVHVMTSLAGFEALLLGKEVHCHGLPFYAGWGLTQDALPCPRRTRTLTLDQLVAGALLLYPRYFSAQMKRLCSAEEAVGELVRGRQPYREPAFWWKWVLRMMIRKT